MRFLPSSFAFSVHSVAGALVVAPLLCACSKSDGGNAANPPVDAFSTDGADAGSVDPGASVLQHHKNATRDGLYVDSAFDKASAAKLHRDPGFAPPALSGNVYAQPLFTDGGGAGADLVYVVTEDDVAYAVDGATGAIVWQRPLGTSVRQANLRCGNVDPSGITGTPVIDPASRTLFVDAMSTPDGGKTKQHMIYALSIDDGSVRHGWPLDVSASVTAGGVKFDSSVQQQRGALLFANGTLYVPFGGFYGDCGDFHGWVVAVQPSDPPTATGWATPTRGSGIWATGGLSSDGSAIFLTTGNGIGAGGTWAGSEAVLRIGAGASATFSNAATDYFAPSNWKVLDSADTDLGGSGALIVDAPAATPSKLIVALGKDGNAYVLDRTNLGGVGGQLAVQHVATSTIIQAAATYTTSSATYVVFRGQSDQCPPGQSGELTAFTIAGSPPGVKVAWCAKQNGRGSPIVTSNGASDFIVWGIGAEGDKLVHGFDADTGAVVSAGNDAFGATRHFLSPIVAKGRLYVVSDGSLHAYTTR